MIYVGLLGGASYVNVYYLILKDKKIKNDERELVVNITQIMYSLGILMSSLSVIALDETIYK